MVLLNMKDAKRLEVIQRVMDFSLTRVEAAKVLAVEVRQVYRILADLRSQGIQGIIHGNRGNQHAVKWSEAKKAKLLSLIDSKYGDINDTQLKELLEEREGIMIGRETLRQFLRKTGKKSKVRRSSPSYRAQRERKEAFGMLIQIDASIHDWLEGQCPKFSLIGGIDDATGFVWARFEESENAWGYFRLLEDIILSHGIPLSLYSDRHTIFHSPKEPTVIEQIQNIRPLTQFGRAMKELGIEMIKAYSPQAKGRIERLWRTFQDRLVVELRLAKIKNREEANEFLKGFLIKYNKRFTKPARHKQKVFRKRPLLTHLNRTLCFKETRVVNKDHTIQFEGFKLQIPPSSHWASISGQKVTVLQLENGTLEVWYKQIKVLGLTKEQLKNLVIYYEKQLKQLNQAA